MIKVGSIVRDMYNNKIGIVTRIHHSENGRSVIGYTIFGDDGYQPITVGFVEVIKCK